MPVGGFVEWLRLGVLTVRLSGKPLHPNSVIDKLRNYQIAFSTSVKCE